MQLVLKIGGSIFDNTLVFEDFLNLFAIKLHPSMIYIVIAGGGRKCNQLRDKYKVDTHVQGKDDAYHWEAIRLMGENAKMIKKRLDLLSKSAPSQLISDISARLKPGISFVDPFDYLCSKDPLDHSWRVTSDSIAIYFAHIFQSPFCVLVKNKPFLKVGDTQIRKITSSFLQELQEKEENNDKLGKGLTDPFSPHLCIQYNLPLLILDGTDLQVVSEFLTKIPEQLERIDLSNFGIEITPK